MEAKYSCDICATAFSRKDNLKRHIDSNACKPSPIIKKLMDKIKKLEKENKKLKELLETKSIIVSGDGNNVGNITNNNTTNNITNNINIVLNFNKPNTKYFITEIPSVMGKLKNKTAEGIYLQLFDYIYNNPEHPENRSIKFEDGEIKIMQNEWIITSGGRAVKISLDKIKENLFKLDEYGEYMYLVDDEFGQKDENLLSNLGELCHNKDFYEKLPPFLRKHLDNSEQN